MPVVKGFGSSLKKALAAKPQGPIWAGPCGEGPQGGVTQSLLCKFLQCRERFRLRTVEGWQPRAGFQIKLEFGNLWHTCEEHLAMKSDWESALGAHAGRLCRQYRESQEEIKKWCAVIATQFPVYIKYWKTHPHMVGRKPILAEKMFDVPYPLPSGRIVRLRGKWDSIDAVYPKKGGTAGVWLMENKTKNRIEELKITRRLTFDIQTMIYYIAFLNADLEDIGISEKTMPGPMLGVRYNVIRRDCPISRHKAKSNKKKGTVTPEETVDHWLSRLHDEYFNANPEEWFMRWEVAVTSADVKRFEQQFLIPCLEDLCDWWREVELAKNDDPPHTLWGISGHYRTPYGAFIVDDYDDYAPMMETGSSVGFERVTDLFPELKEVAA